MRALLAMSVFALGLLVAPAAGSAATPQASVKTLVSAADQQVQIWRQASSRVVRTKARASELAGRIDALKRSGAQRAELQRLLEASLAAESTLERALTAQADARDDLERTVRVGVGRIDREIRAIVPALKAGPIGDRRAAARRINDLRGARQALRESLRALESDTQAAPRRDWSRYEVRIEPLDGPSELEEKADFVEDTRDKLAKKRLAIAKLLREAKQEQQIARAARDFDTYVRIFDEEARSDRVARARTQGETTALADSSNNGNGGNEQGPSAPVDLSSGFQGNNRNGAESPDPAAPQTEGSTDGPLTGGVDDKVGGGQTPTGPSVGTPDPTAPPVARDINADVLINLRVSQLSEQELDLPTLLRLVEELEDLDRYLADQASSIRERARALEADESRNLGDR